MKISTFKLVFIFLLFFYLNSHAQKITLAELHVMSANKNWETSNKYLLSKDWEYNNSEKGDDEHYNIITWAYNKTGYEKEKAIGWFSIYTYDGLPNQVMYRFRKKEFYLAIKQQLILNKYKLQEEEVLDEKVIATYSNTSFILKLEYSRETNEDETYSGSFTVYNITVSKKGGVYDPDNGSKKDFDEHGTIKAAYALKDGKVNGPVKFFNPDGSIQRTSFVKMGVENGLSTTYIYQDSSSISVGKYKGEYLNDKKNGKWLLNVITEDTETNLSYSNFVNGIEEGNFRQVHGDSVIYSNYKNGLIDGKYTVFRDLKKMILGGFAETDTTKLIKTSVGYFSENKKSGFWKNFGLDKTLISEGTYIDSLRTGKWKFYYSSYSDADNKIPDYSGQLYLEKNYLNGLENGASIRYSYLDEIEVPCDADKNKTCLQKEFVKVYEISNYSNGALDGPYELKNQDNELYLKGQYLNGAREGKWVVRNESIVKDWNVQSNEYGNFVNDLKEGKWERFDDNHHLTETYNYNNGLLNGAHILFNLSNRPIEKRTFSKGMLIELTILDEAENLITKYQLNDITETKYNCVKTERGIDGIYTKSYSVSRTMQEKIDPSTFKIDFEALPNTAKILDGFYNQKSLDDQLIEEGNYKNNKKVGTWTTFYYDQKVKTAFEFDVYGNLQKEFYYDLKREEPFSGEFLFTEKNAKISEERKIKEGLRNGTTRYKDANDKTIKKESYKEGILKV